MKDHRLPPFVWQGRAAMERVRHCFDGRERTMAVAIYQAMTTLANDARGLSFNASRKEIAQLAGVGLRSIDRYVTAFERVGLVEIGRTNGEASSYTLVEPEGADPAQEPRTPRAAEVPPPAQEPRTPRLYEEEEEERTTGDDPRPDQPNVDEGVRKLWDVWLELFGDRMRNRELTPARIRTFSKALKAAPLELCIDAAYGLHAYVRNHPDRPQTPQPSRIFETGPHSSSNLSDQIEWWAEQRDASSGVGTGRRPLDLSGFSPATRQNIEHKRERVRLMYEYEPDDAQGKEAEEWLREKLGHKPIIVDGHLTGWDYV